MLLLAGGGERADLVVGAGPAGAPGRRRIEAAGPNAGGGRLDGGDRFLHVVGGRHVAANYVRIDEPELDPLGQAARHLAPGQRVHLELEVLGHPAIGVLLAGDVTGLVVDDHGAQQILVHTVVAAAHAIGPEREPELLLHPGGLDAVRLLLVPEALERLAAGRLAGFLVLAGEEALGGLATARTVQDVLAGPGALVDGQQVV